MGMREEKARQPEAAKRPLGAAATAAAESEIRQLIDTFLSAVRAKDLDKIISLCAPNITSFDVMGPLAFVGRDTYRKAWEKGFAAMTSPRIEPRDLHIAVSGDVAFAHSLSHLAASSPRGAMDFWSRWTGCFQRINGKWLLTHEHVSFPTDMESGRALTDLQPEVIQH